ncbi:amino acid ABC transporter substrate-binding protein, PAAT family [Donghicola eburneus]|uniref:Amino acid ABC transporter substrate-binding protein n=2 Tax=Donghicola eburneus TaxID=393278 RepID=A0A1M4N0J4_9RHOB|nr:substrate-binding domain-containing protein [Donghicola eburneus]SCM67545.1 amino acid ABC transporter substrate-binding protein [Donghicola eburneus]SFQ06925.1 amino acid ABC transporter substrate-binding protein, PAAT family [Donghicola eburneus]
MLSAKLKMPAWERKSALKVLAVALCGLLPVSGAAQTSDLVSHHAFRVCADPANLPMSDDQGRGYENRLAELFASKLDLPVEYEWYPMATGFIRNTLKAAKCDVVIGYAQGHEMVLNTNHYMTSGFVLVAPRDSDLSSVSGLSDPALQGKRIGIVAGTPPATHMARYGLIGKAKPYNLTVDRRYESPVVNMLEDLKAQEIDAAILWGPLGGPLVKSDYPGMTVLPLLGETLPPKMFYRITMGVRQGEKVWQRKLNSLIRRHQDEINAILMEAGVPLLDAQGQTLLELPQ